jgi:hypothetical protein
MLLAHLQWKETRFSPGSILMWQGKENSERRSAEGAHVKGKERDKNDERQSGDGNQQLEQLTLVVASNSVLDTIELLIQADKKDIERGQAMPGAVE